MAIYLALDDLSFSPFKEFNGSLSSSVASDTRVVDVNVRVAVPTVGGASPVDMVPWVVAGAKQPDDEDVDPAELTDPKEELPDMPMEILGPVKPLPPEVFSGSSRVVSCRSGKCTDS